jgi:hypothetical protein
MSSVGSLVVVRLWSLVLLLALLLELVIAVLNPSSEGEGQEERRGKGERPPPAVFDDAEHGESEADGDEPPRLGEADEEALDHGCTLARAARGGWRF